MKLESVWCFRSLLLTYARTFDSAPVTSAGSLRRKFQSCPPVRQFPHRFLSVFSCPWGRYLYERSTISPAAGRRKSQLRVILNERKTCHESLQKKTWYFGKSWVLARILELKGTEKNNKFVKSTTEYCNVYKCSFFSAENTYCYVRSICACCCMSLCSLGGLGLLVLL